MNWPASLPIPLASGYSYADVFDIVRPDQNLGFSPTIRRGQINSPGPVDVSLILTFHEFAVLDWLISKKLIQGAKFLMMPIKLDDALIHNNARILKVSPSTEGKHWRVSMSLEIMPPPVTEADDEVQAFYQESVQLTANQETVFQPETMPLCSNHALQINENGSLTVSATSHTDSPFVPIGEAQGPVIARVEGLFRAFELLPDSNMTVYLLGNNRTDFDDS